MEWLAIWGVTQAFGFVFTSIFLDLAKEAGKLYAKDFFKQCLGEVVSILDKDVLKEAYGKALKEFVELIQEELQDAEYQDIQIQQFTEPLESFIKNADVAGVLGSAFDLERREIDSSTLAKQWQEMNLPTLPENLNWEKLSKRYQRKVKAILKESEKLQPLLEISQQNIATKSLQELAGIIPEFSLKTYAEDLKKRYGNLKLDSLDSSGSAYNQLRLWNIFVPQTVRACQEFLPQVYEMPKDLLDKLRERGEIDEQELAKYELEESRRRYVNQSPRSVLEMLAESDKKYVVILGDPGSGKSTLLQYLALDWAEKPLRELPAYPLPLLIELRLYAQDKRAGKCNSFLEFLHQGNVSCRLNQIDLDQKLRDGHVIALFDGVDEVFEPQLRKEIVTDIHRFTNNYKQVRVVVTSRWLGYKAQRFRDAEFEHFMLQDFEDEQVTQFIETWHELTFGADATSQIERERKEARLKKAVTESKAIHQLAVNPLLLTMMAILNRYQELPRDRAKLYERASEVLLHQWDIERDLIDQNLDPTTIDVGDKQAILRKVADYMQASKDGLKGNVIEAEDLKQIIIQSLKEMDIQDPRKVAGAMLIQLRHRNFILCDLGANNYGFVHRTFLEYFCASALVRKFEKTKDLTFEELWQQTFESHWQDETWAEVLRLIAGMLEAQFTGKIIKRLIDIDGEEINYENIFLAAECLLEVRQRSEIQVIAQTIKIQIEQLIELQVPNVYDQYTADLARSIRQVHQKAIQAIATVWQSEQTTVAWLKQRAQHDDHWAVRQAAVQELARGWKNDPDTLPILKQRAQYDDDNDVRKAAVQELARGWKNDPDTLPILKQRAQHDDNWAVRQAAVQELARGWKNDPDTLPWLKQRAQHDDDNDVRKAAVQELARGWKNETNISNFFAEIVLQDPFERGTGDFAEFENNPRQTALEILVKSYRDIPRTIEVLRDRAEHDADKQVRNYAAKQLEKLRSTSRQHP